MINLSFISPPNTIRLGSVSVSVLFCTFETHINVFIGKQGMA